MALHKLLRNSYYAVSKSDWKDGSIYMPSNYEILISAANHCAVGEDIYISLS